MPTARPIYSHQLMNRAFIGAHAGIIDYTVPADTLVVVTNIDYYTSFTVAGQQTYVTLKSLILLQRTATGAQEILAQWAGRQVLNAGDQISWTTNSAYTAVGITGYVLGP